MTAELRGCGIDNRYLQSDTHRGSKCLFSSPRVYGIDRGVSSPLWSSFNHTLIAARKGGGAGEAKEQGCWEAESGPRGKGGDHTAAAAQILISSRLRLDLG